MAAQYTISPIDSGTQISCVETLTDVNGTRSITSAAIDVANLDAGPWMEQGVHSLRSDDTISAHAATALMFFSFDYLSGTAGRLFHSTKLVLEIRSSGSLRCYAQDSDGSSEVVNTLINSNVFLGCALTRVHIEAEFYGLTARNNLYLQPAIDQSAGSFFKACYWLKYQDGASSSPDPEIAQSTGLQAIHANTFATLFPDGSTSDGTERLFAINSDVPSDMLVEANNLLYAPQLSGGGDGGATLDLTPLFAPVLRSSNGIPTRCVALTNPKGHCLPSGSTMVLTRRH